MLCMGVHSMWRFVWQVRLVCIARFVHDAMRMVRAARSGDELDVLGSSSQVALQLPSPLISPSSVHRDDDRQSIHSIAPSAYIDAAGPAEMPSSELVIASIAMGTAMLMLAELAPSMHALSIVKREFGARHKA